MLSTDEDMRYSRQLLAEVAGQRIDQDRVRAGRIAVVGAGTLGSNFVMGAAAVGISCDVFDFDTVGPETLGRSIAFLPEDIGQAKAVALSARAGALNPDVDMRPVVGDALLGFGSGIWEDYDVLVLLTDDVRTRAELSAIALSLPAGPSIVIEAGLRGFDWHVQVMSDATHCYECTLPAGSISDARQSCNGVHIDEAGQILPTTLTSAFSSVGIAVQETLLSLSGAEPRFLGRSVRASMGVPEIAIFTHRRRASCTHHPRWDESAVLRVKTTGMDASALCTEIQRRLGTQAVITAQRPVVRAIECTRCGTTTRVGQYLAALRVPTCTRCGLIVEEAAGCRCGTAAPSDSSRRLECHGCGLLDPNRLVIDASTIIQPNHHPAELDGVLPRDVLFAHGSRVVPVILE